MKVEATTKVRYADGPAMTTPPGLTIETSMTIAQDQRGYSSRQGIADIPMTFVERTQDSLRKTVVATLAEAQKGS